MWQMPSVSENPRWRGRDSSESGPSGRGVTVLFGSPNVIGPGYSITACLALTTKKKKKKKKKKIYMELEDFFF